jgi:hypothetical protein
MNNVILGYGDFNDDLRTDYAALDPTTNNLLLFYYINDGDQNGQYLLTKTIPF